MKARIKATGEIFELCPYVYDIDGNDFLLDEIELLNNPNWQHYRIQAAIAAMQGMMSSEFYCNTKTRNDSNYTKYREKWGVNQITREAVAYADALITELKKGGQQ